MDLVLPIKVEFITIHLFLISIPQIFLVMFQAYLNILKKILLFHFIKYQPEFSNQKDDFISFAVYSIVLHFKTRKILLFEYQIDNYF